MVRAILRSYIILQTGKIVKWQRNVWWWKRHPLYFACAADFLWLHAESRPAYTRRHLRNGADGLSTCMARAAIHPQSWRTAVYAENWSRNGRKPAWLTVWHGLTCDRRYDKIAIPNDGTIKIDRYKHLHSRSLSLSLHPHDQHHGVVEWRPFFPPFSSSFYENRKYVRVPHGKRPWVCWSPMFTARITTLHSREWRQSTAAQFYARASLEYVEQVWMSV